MRSVLAVFFALALAGPACADERYGDFHALVIGNDDYQHQPKLKTAVKDARDVAAVLRGLYGYRVTLLENTSFRELRGALWSYRKELRQTDNLLVYYAGHGYVDRDTGEGYWLPVDAQENPADWVSNSTITTALKAIPAKHVMVVSDSCYSGSLTRGLTVKIKGQDYFTKISARKARVVMTSGGLEPVNDEGSGGNSVFAVHFLRALRTNPDVMDGTDLFSAVRRPVMLAADQTPTYGDIRKCGHDGGDFLFVRRKARPAPAPAQPKPPTGPTLQPKFPSLRLELAGPFLLHRPQGWRRGPEKVLRLKTFLVDDAECTFIHLPGMFLPQLRVNEWRKELGLVPTSDFSDLGSLPMLNRRATLVKLSGSLKNGRSILAAVISAQVKGKEGYLYIKLTGPTPTVLKHEQAFLGMCKTMQRQ